MTKLMMMINKLSNVQNISRKLSFHTFYLSFSEKKHYYNIIFRRAGKQEKHGHASKVKYVCVLF